MATGLMTMSVCLMPAVCLQLLNILFCTLMFSGGLPLVLPLVSIIFAITYWAEKWELLKLSRVPSPYSGDLAALTGICAFPARPFD